MTSRTDPRWRYLPLLLAGVVPVLLAVGLAVGRADDLDPRVLEAENRRVAIIEKVKPSVVAIFAGGGTNGGSGVLISADGFVLTNFHVVEATGPVMKCGLPDGFLYDGVLVGLDKVGDVALIKLLPRKEGVPFPFAPMGDSDKVRAGDWSLALGNPFLLATDFTPTVTYGLVSGIHRYQYPAGTLLEYTDCIQIDTSINPGNSGGPLFNLDGELIGINGRGSFEKRGRVNSGVGYAISINQIKNFLGQLRAGLDTDHASLGASMESESEEGALSRVLVRSIIDCDARRRGLDTGDQLVSFAGRPITTVNQFKNVLGLFPKGWRVPLKYRRETEKGQTETKEILVRLMGVQRQELSERGEGSPRPQPAPRARRRPGPPSPAAKFYEPKSGFANYYFNRVEQERLLGLFRKHGDFSGLKGDWTFKASGLLYAGHTRGKRMAAEVTIKDRGARDGKNDLVQGIIDGLDYSLEPLNDKEKAIAFKDPPESGGLLLALYQYRQLLALGPKGFVGEFSHGGIEPFYLPSPVKDRPDYAKQRIDAEVLRTRHAGVQAKWYFSMNKDETRGQLLGFEVTPDRDEDPCEVYLSDYKEVDGRKLPGRMEVRNGDKVYAVLTMNAYKMEPAR